MRRLVRPALARVPLNSHLHVAAIVRAVGPGALGVGRQPHHTEGSCIAAPREAESAEVLGVVYSMRLELTTRGEEQGEPPYGMEKRQRSSLTLRKSAPSSVPPSLAAGPTTG